MGKVLVALFFPLRDWTWPFFFFQLLIHLESGSWSPNGVRSTSSLVWRRCPRYKHSHSGSWVWRRVPVTHTVTGNPWKPGHVGLQMLAQEGDAAGAVAASLPASFQNPSQCHPPCDPGFLHSNSWLSMWILKLVTCVQILHGPLTTWANRVWQVSHMWNGNNLSTPWLCFCYD